MQKPTISRFAVEILGKLAAGRPAVLKDDGGLRLSGRTVPESVLRALLARDLVQTDEGRVTITPAGEACLRRRRTPRATARAVGAFRSQHMTLTRRREPAGRNGERAFVNGTESPLGWLARRRGRDGRPLLSERQYLAGERLREDFERSGLGPRLVRAYDAPPVSRGRRGGAQAPAMPADQAIDARRRVHAALAAMGPGLADIALRTCCFLEGLAEAEQAIGWPARSGKVVLSLALDRLADFYEGKKMGARGRPVGKGMPG
ncbi:MAG: hypothetical protein D6807_03030 [Alphaproteobacteria bacterium]|nr:MAG: hypothetical protein D6807_03030 [Alphaproteobacteria bacterium]